MGSLINYRIRVSVKDGRQLVGRFMAFDRHMNLVLGDSEEFRNFHTAKAKEGREERRVLGLTILRGEEVVSLVVEGPPPADTVRVNLPIAPPGPGLACAAGRGITV